MSSVCDAVRWLCFHGREVDLLVQILVHFSHHGNVITPDDVQSEWNNFDSLTLGIDSLMTVVHDDVYRLVKSFHRALHHRRRSETHVISINSRQKTRATSKLTTMTRPSAVMTVTVPAATKIASVPTLTHACTHD